MSSLIPLSSAVPSSIRALVVRAPGKADQRFAGERARPAAAAAVADCIVAGVAAEILAEVDLPATAPLPRVVSPIYDDETGEQVMSASERIAAAGPAVLTPASSAVTLADLLESPFSLKSAVSPRVLAIVNEGEQEESTWTRPVVDQAAVPRIQRDSALASAHGLALPPGFYAEGTRMISTGVAAARAERFQHEALPDALPAMERLEAEVKAEDRRDVIVGLAQLRMTTDLRLAKEGGPLAPMSTSGREGLTRVAVEEAALRSLCTDLRAGVKAGGDLGIATLAAMPQASLREAASATFNRCASALGDLERGGATRKTVALRTRKVEVRDEQTGEVLPQRREQVYAVVSEGYGECDADKIARACADLVRDADGQIKADVIYDRAAGKVKIDLVTRTTVLDKDQRVGDATRVGLRVRSDDTGKGSLNVWAFGERIACLNRTLVSAEGAHTVIRHLGNPERLLERLREALSAASGALLAFARQWASASLAPVHAKIEAEKREHRDALAKLVAEIDIRSKVEGALASIGLSPSGSDLLEGTYRSLVRRHDLASAKETEEQVVALRAAHWHPSNAGTSREVAGGLTHAAVANGLTLWAQSQPLARAHAAEELAGRVISGDEVLTWLAAPAARA